MLSEREHVAPGSASPGPAPTRSRVSSSPLRAAAVDRLRPLDLIQRHGPEQLFHLAGREPVRFLKIITVGWS